MNFLVISLFVSVFSLGYLAQQVGIIPTYFVLVPELLSAIAMLLVLARLLGARSMLLDWRYGVFLALFAFVLLFGFMAQSVPSGAVVAGLRNYVKFLPFFLLPAIYPFTGRQLKTQLVVLLTILALQSPLAVYQRFVQFGDRLHTGDPVRGTAATSSALTMLMIGAVALVVTLYLRRRIKLPVLLAALAVFILPTTLNETKSTLVLLPVAMLAPALFMPQGARAMRRLVPLVAIAVLALGAYATVYNSLIQNREYGKDLGAFFTEGHVEDYLYTGAAEGEGTWIGRFDSVAIAARSISADPLKLAFGLGAGNVSQSSLPGFNGQYVSFVERYGVDVTQVSNFLWEIGFVGLFGYLLLYWFVFQDARVLAKSEGPSGMCGQVWATVVIVMAMALMYKSVFAMNEIAYLFWFYSGVVAREAYLRRHRVASDAAGARAGAARRRLGANTALGLR